MQVLSVGLFLTKYPHLDMVSFGPTLQNVHSPSERMHIPAVERYWQQLRRIIEKVAELEKIIKPNTKVTVRCRL